MHPKFSTTTAFVHFQATADSVALGQVFDATAPELMRVASYLTTDLNTAEDLVQATFLVAIEKAQSFNPKFRILPWLLGTLTTQARKVRVIEGRRNTLLHFPSSDAPGPHDSLESAELSEVVSKAIAELPEAYRPVLTMRLKHGFSTQEIGMTLHRPPGTVRKQLSRGMELLRKALPSSLTAGAVILTTQVSGMAAMREVVLSKASLGASQSTSALVLGKLGMGALAGAMLTVAAGVVLFNSAGEPASNPDISPAASPQIGVQTKVAALPVAGSRIQQLDPLSSSSRVLRAYSSPVATASEDPGIQVDSMGGTSASASSGLVLPGLLFGSMALLPARGYSQNVLYSHSGENAHDFLADSVSGVGDVNGDGNPDILSGAPFADSDPDGIPGNGDELSAAGKGFVWSGKDGVTLHMVEGAVAEARMGWSQAPAGDANLDGYADFAFGAYLELIDPDGVPGNADDIINAGKVHVYSGRDGSELWQRSAENSLDFLGRSLCGGEDLNGDGIPDVVAGAPFFSIDPDGTADTGDEHANVGRVYAFSGFDGSTLWTRDGESAGIHLATVKALSLAGDFNADGVADVMASSFLFDPDPDGIPGNGDELVDAGRVYLYSGMTGATLWTLDGENAGDYLSTVSGNGDVNADGSPDMVIGAPGWDDPADPDFGPGPDGTLGNFDDTGANHGRAYVISSIPLPLTADTHLLSVSVANSQVMTLDAGVAHAGKNYWLFTGFAVSGDTPGVTMAPGVVIPLNQPDPLTSFVIDLTQLGGGAPTFTGWKGALDGAGRAFSSLNTSGPSAMAVGVTLHHAALVYTANGCGAGCDTFHMATNWVPMTTTP